MGPVPPPNFDPHEIYSALLRSTRAPQTSLPRVQTFSHPPSGSGSSRRAHPSSGVIALPALSLSLNYYVRGERRRVREREIEACTYASNRRSRIASRACKTTTSIVFCSSRGGGRLHRRGCFANSGVALTSREISYVHLSTFLRLCCVRNVLISNPSRLSVQTSRA